MSKELKRCCRNCGHVDMDADGYFKEKGLKAEAFCLEGGLTEIGDPDKEMTPEDCSAYYPDPLLKNAWIDEHGNVVECPN